MYKNLYANVYSSFIIMVKNLSFNWWMNEQTVVHSYHGILLGYKKYIDTHNNMDGCQTHYAKWKKPNSKGCILYNSICMTFWQKQNYEKKNRVVTRVWGIGEGVDFKGTAWKNFFGWWNCSESWLWRWLQISRHLSKFRTVDQKEWVLLFINK